jgi:hypothetical protein
MAEEEPQNIFNRRRSRLSVWERADLRAEDRHRMLQNIAAAVFVIALILAGMWVIDGIIAYNKSMECLQYRMKRCQ